MKAAESLIILIALPALIVVILLMKLKESLFGPTYFVGGGAPEGAMIVLGSFVVSLVFWIWLGHQLVTHLKWV